MRQAHGSGLTERHNVYTVGQQILGGKAVIIFIFPDGRLRVEFTALDDGIGGHPILTYDPAGTVMPLEDWVQALLDILG